MAGVLSSKNGSYRSASVSFVIEGFRFASPTYSDCRLRVRARKPFEILGREGEHGLEDPDAICLNDESTLSLSDAI